MMVPELFATSPPIRGSWLAQMGCIHDPDWWAAEQERLKGKPELGIVEFWPEHTVNEQLEKIRPYFADLNFPNDEPTPERVLVFDWLKKRFRTMWIKDGRIVQERYNWTARFEATWEPEWMPLFYQLVRAPFGTCEFALLKEYLTCWFCLLEGAYAQAWEDFYSEFIKLIGGLHQDSHYDATCHAQTVRDEFSPQRYDDLHLRLEWPAQFGTRLAIYRFDIPDNLKPFYQVLR